MTPEAYTKWYVIKMGILMLFCSVGSLFILVKFGISLYSFGGIAFIIVACSIGAKIGNPPEPDDIDG
jgi:hypothetical protein